MCLFVIRARIDFKMSSNCTNKYDITMNLIDTAHNSLAKQKAIINYIYNNVVNSNKFQLNLQCHRISPNNFAFALKMMVMLTEKKIEIVKN